LAANSAKTAIGLVVDMPEALRRISGRGVAQLLRLLAAWAHRAADRNFSIGCIIQDRRERVVRLFYQHGAFGCRSLVSQIMHLWQPITQ
jgi:hypothetical protein